MNGKQLTSVFMQLRTSLRNRAMAILHSDVDSDDVLQDAFCRLWTRREDIADERHAAGLSYAAVKSVSIDRLRSRAAYVSETVEAGVDAEDRDDADRGDAYEEIDAMLEQCLGGRDREILRKREMYGYGYDELAVEYGMSQEAVRAVVSRGRRAIRSAYIEKYRK